MTMARRQIAAGMKNGWKVCARGGGDGVSDSGESVSVLKAGARIFDGATLVF